MKIPAMPAEVAVQYQAAKKNGWAHREGYNPNNNTWEIQVKTSNGTYIRVVAKCEKHTKPSPAPKKTTTPKATPQKATPKEKKGWW